MTYIVVIALILDGSAFRPSIVKMWPTCGVCQELLSNEAHKTGEANFINLVFSFNSVLHTLRQNTTLENSGQQCTIILMLG